LPNGDGLFRFTTVDEAVAAFEVINSDYHYQCDAARQLAEKYFDAESVARIVLEAALA
jgi:membrane-bound inhibitor of C-type lysozyme